MPDDTHDLAAAMRQLKWAMMESTITAVRHAAAWRAVVAYEESVKAAAAAQWWNSEMEVKADA